MSFDIAVQAADPLNRQALSDRILEIKEGRFCVDTEQEEDGLDYLEEEAYNEDERQYT